MHDPVTSFVVAVFSTPGAALMMAGAILVFAIGLIIQSGHFEYVPLRDDLTRRADLLNELRGDRQVAFAEVFDQIDKRLGDVANPVLELGWAHYRSQLTATDDGRLATSIHASDAFDHADAPARTLEWWANLMVAIGLVITFMGIVAALTEATAAMAPNGAAAGGAAMQGALIHLLTIAATKFWTSIAGVLASIILRLAARRRRQAIEGLEAHFFALLDTCVRFAPPEKVMLEQLAVLTRIEAALARSGAAPAPRAGAA